jgi:predicted ATPase
LGHACARARELCQQIGETPQLFPALWFLGAFYGMRAEHGTAMESGERMLGLAERIEDSLLIAVAHCMLGWVMLSLGEFKAARAHLEHMSAFYDPQQHHALAFVYGQDPGVFCRAFLSHVLWHLGYPDQALKRSQEVIALAQELNHPYTLALALLIAGAGHHLFGRREFQAVRAYAEPLVELSQKEGLTQYETTVLILKGRVRTESGQVEEGIEQMVRGLDEYEATSGKTYRPQLLLELGKAYGKAGQVEQGLSVIADAQADIQETSERYYEAESHRVKGELLLMQEDDTEAEACFYKAIEVAQKQEAKSWELRAAMSMARLWEKQGKKEEGHKLLADVYNWFTEGFDTADMKDAKALLEELT